MQLHCAGNIINVIIKWENYIASIVVYWSKSEKEREKDRGPSLKVASALITAGIIVEAKTQLLQFEKTK